MREGVKTVSSDYLVEVKQTWGMHSAAFREMDGCNHLNVVVVAVVVVPPHTM